MRPLPSSLGKAPLSKAEKAALVAVAFCVLQTIVKFVLARWGQSLAVLAEAYHSMSDILTSFLVFAALRIDQAIRQTLAERAAAKEKDGAPPAVKDSEAPSASTDPSSGVAAPARESTEAASPSADAAAPSRGTASEKGRGFHGVEHAVTAGIAVFLTVLALSIAWRALWGTMPQIRQPLLTGVIFFVLALFSYFISSFEFQVAKSTGSLAVKADAYHNRIDMWSSFLVGLALLLQGWIGWQLDRVAALFVSLILLVMAFDLFASQIQSLRRGGASSSDASIPLPSPQSSPTESTPLPSSQTSSPATEAPSEAAGEKTSPSTKEASPPPEAPPEGAPFEAGADASASSRLWLGWLVRSRDAPWRARLRQFWLVRYGRRLALGLAALIFLLLWGSTSAVTVRFNEVGLLERFGSPRPGVLRPGLHWVWPYPVERVRRVNITTVHQLRLGFEKEFPSPEILWERRHIVGERSYLSSDQNLLTIYLLVQYRIRKPREFLYRVKKPKKHLAQSTYRLLLQEFSQRPFFQISTTGRRVIERTLKRAVQKEMNALGAGIEVVEMLFRDLHPPAKVAPFFEDVVTAREAIVLQKNRALAYRIRALAKAWGTAFRLQAEATSQRNNRVVNAEEEALQRSLLYRLYRPGAEPLLFRQLLEAMRIYHAQTQKIIIDPRLSGLDLWLEGE